MHHERSLDEILDRVYRRARRLRVRKLASHAASGALAMTLVGGGVVFALTRPPSEPEPLHDGVIPTLTAEPKPSVKPSESKKPTPKATPKTSPKSDPKASPKESPAPTDPKCLNSFDPACGEFRWASQPAKDTPMSVTVTAPATVEVGTDVSFAVRLSDPDAKIWRDAYKLDFGDGTRIYGPADKSCKKAYGPWTVPPRGGDAYETVYHHTFTTPGTYKAWMKFLSIDRRDVWPRPCQQAYGDYGYVERTIVVTEPEPEPSPSPSV